MKKLIIILSIAMFFSPLFWRGAGGEANAQAPNWAWAKSAGGTSYDWGRSCSTDSNGNIFVTGSFDSGSITFGTTTLTNASADTADMFIVKYDQSGNVLWAQGAGGTSYDYGNSVSTDTSGNVYVTGYFYSSSITFGTTTLTNAGTGTDIFIAKYDQSGNVLWAQRAGGTSTDIGWGVSTDASGNIIATGSFTSPTITFGSLTLTSAGAGTDMFIVKYDQSGNVLWAKISGGGNSGSGGGNSCSTDLSGNIIATGIFVGIFSFGSFTLISGVGSYDMFIVKYDLNGNVLWAKSAGGTSNDWGESVSIPQGGTDVFVTGSFLSPAITFGTTTLTNASADTTDIFIVKYDAAGTVLWANSAGGTSSDRGWSCSTDAGGNAFVTGSFSSDTITFGTTTLTNTSGVPYSDIFIVKYAPSGTVLWAKSAGGTSSVMGFSVSIPQGGTDVFVTGSFQSPAITFGTDTLTNADNTGNTLDIFIAKLDSATCNASISGNTTICSGDFTTLTASGGTTYSWSTGNTTASVIVSPAVTTSYTVTATIGTCLATASVTVTVNPTPTVTIIVSPPMCSDTTYLCATGGCSYQWSTGSTASCIYVTTGGNYSVTASCGSCSTTASVFVPTYTLLTLSVTATNASCSSCADGSATVYPSGGTPGYTYQWVPAGQTTQTITGLSMGTYSVCVTDANGCSTCDTITVNFATGIDNFSSLQNVQIYPNPTSGKFTIQLATGNWQLASSQKQVASIEIYNVLGEKVTQSVIPSPATSGINSARNLTIDLSDVPSGIYFITIRTEQGRVTKKLIIQK